MKIRDKYDAFKTKYENINIMLKKAGYQIYSCYSNHFDKNILFSSTLQKLLFKWTEF